MAPDLALPSVTSKLGRRKLLFPIKAIGQSVFSSDGWSELKFVARDEPAS